MITAYDRVTPSDILNWLLNTDKFYPASRKLSEVLHGGERRMDRALNDRHDAQYLTNPSERRIVKGILANDDKALEYGRRLDPCIVARSCENMYG